MEKCLPSLEHVPTATDTIATSDPERAGTTFWKFYLRPAADDEPQDWWFASTACPLLAATTGPLANILSIAALVTSWRNNIPQDGPGAGTDAASVGFPDPHWCIALNVTSLIAGFIGNFALLLNFTQRIRYIIALPVSILLWLLATGILIAITVAMHLYVPPIRPHQTYSQGFWYAVIAAVLYYCSVLVLIINMVGYVLGHYPQNFTLTEHQQTLILQTMMFFFWLAAGAAMFSRICGWHYVDALYFCDVTVLTIGFGDFAATNNASRGLVIPFSFIGIITLGLMVNSIRKFALGLGHDNIIKPHIEKERSRTFGRSIVSEKQLRERLGLRPRRGSDATSFLQKGATENRKNSLADIVDIRGTKVIIHDPLGGHKKHRHHSQRGGGAGKGRPIAMRLSSQAANQLLHTRSRGAKLLLLKEEKDRFDAMRKIQAETSRFKRWGSLMMSVTAFGLLWCVGALVFHTVEQHQQEMSYFQALYFCYVSLLTIGYGDLSPKSNAGKPFFVVWSLLAVPTMTLLISDMGDTVIASFRRGIATLSDWTIMPREGVWGSFLDDHPALKDYIQHKLNERAGKKRVKRGFEVGSDEAEAIPTLEKLAEDGLTEHEIARKLAAAIKHIAVDLRNEPKKKYSYEQWVEFTRLIRFSASGQAELEAQENTEGIIEWDWIGEDSPMLADMTEPEWLLNRLCESLDRYTVKQNRSDKREQGTEEGTAEGGSDHQLETDRLKSVVRNRNSTDSIREVKSNS